MTDVSGIPNLGIPGMGGGAILGGNAATGQPALSSAQIMASLYGNYSPGQAQSTLNNIYGPQGFGGQTAQYAAQGAAYGRAVPSLAGGFPNTPAGYAAARAANSGGIGSDAARAPNQPPVPPPKNGGVNPYAGMILGPQANPSYFNPGTYAGDQGNYGIPYNGQPLPGDIGFSKQPSYPNLGYNPGMQNYFANPGMSGGDFQSRFGMGFPNAGQPSQYAPGAQMPPGFSRGYDVDNPNGALPLGYQGPGGGSGGNTGVGAGG